MATETLFKTRITITNSKILAYLIFGFSVFLDMHYDLKGTIFMYGCPIAAGLIVGKQALDGAKNFVDKKFSGSPQ